MSENLENKAARGSISQIILKALSDGDKYGYEICKDIENLTDGKLILKQPSLYSSLRRMEEQDLISSYWKDSFIGGRRHYYSLTEKGKKHFEDNKKFWEDDDSILNNLPQKESAADNSPAQPSQNLTQNESLVQTGVSFVANQENLFNLNRNNDKEIKKIDAQEAEQADEFNKSFFQFDFFEQNIKFVKENSRQKQEVSAFTNKFSNMDNHKEEIEPEKSSKIETITAFIKKEQLYGEENANKLALQSDENISSHNDKPVSQPVLKNAHNKIERHEVYKDNSADLRFDKANNELATTTFLPQKELSTKTFSEVKDNNLNDSKNSNKNFDNLKSKQAEDITEFKIKQTTVENKVEPRTPQDDITWDFEYNLDKDNPLFDNNDYKDIIGKLYNNSRLQDPYEQNKFQTFKEIFPASQYNAATKKQNEPRVEDEDKSTLTVDAKNKIGSYLLASEDCNINCEDIKKLNSLYNLQGVEIKVHDFSENKQPNKTYTDKNKLKMISSWVTSTIILLELLFAYILLKGNNLVVGKQPFIFFLGVVFTFGYCIICTLENLFDRFRLIVIKKSFNKTFMQRLFFFILLAVLIFALNLAFGMTSLTEVRFLSYWLVPLILSSNLLISCFVYYLLLKSKSFNS